MVNFLFWICLVLVGLLAWLLLDNYNRAEKKAKEDLAQLRKEVSYERQYTQYKQTSFFKVGKE